MQVTEVVNPNDLRRLYVKLNITEAKVEHAEVGHTDSQLRGKAVLMKWRQEHAGDATKRAILEALEQCDNREASQALIDMWTKK